MTRLNVDIAVRNIGSHLPYPVELNISDLGVVLLDISETRNLATQLLQCVQDIEQDNKENQ